MSPSRLRPGAIIGLAALCFAALYVAALAMPAAAESIPLNATRVLLDTDRPGERKVGRLRFRGGLSIESADLRFGGFSGLSVSADGRQITAVSDKGHWLTAKLRYAPGGDLNGVGDGQLFPIRDGAGKPVRRKRFSDAEALERVNGRLIVAFEHRHRLWSYRALSPAKRARALDQRVLARKHVKSAVIKRNHGIEALAALRGGRLLALAEGPRNDNPLRSGWIVEDARWTSITYRAAPGFRPTGATALPSGDLLVLERRFSWLGGMSARIVRVRAKSIRPGAVLAGTEIARLQAPQTVDNFEGISVRRDGRGRLMVYLISDDNFHILQRTLLFMFELTGDR